MFNIVTIENGFIFNNTEYIFDGEYEIISETQVHIPTNKGILLLDLSCSIDEVSYDEINLFVQALYQVAE
jgi:hypothetical protein